MALYLGDKKVCPVIGTKFAEGTVTSDSNGYVLLPKLDFTPRTIALYKYETYNNDSGEPDSSDIPYRAYNGAICTYLDVGELVHSDSFDEGGRTWQSNWIAMVLYGVSQQFSMAGISANETLQNGAVVKVTEDGRYRLHAMVQNYSGDNEDSPADVTNVELYYRAYA